MASYYAKKRRRGEASNEVHRDKCPHFPKPHELGYLGEYASGHEAMRRGREIYGAVHACPVCVPECSRTWTK